MDDNAAVAYEIDKENVFSTILYKLATAHEPSASSMFPFHNVLLCRVYALFALCDISCKVATELPSSLPSIFLFTERPKLFRVVEHSTG